MFSRIIIVGDESGIPILLNSIDKKQVAAVIIASIRTRLSHRLEKRIHDSGIPIILQPSYSSPEYLSFYEQLKNLNPDCLICNSYSMLIREDILRLVNYNAFNIHTAYLPYNRGPNTFQWPIINNENFTGVTVHCMDKDFDSGDIINQIKEPIYFDDTWVSIRNRLSLVTEKIIFETIPQILSGNYSKIAQDESIATKNFRLTPDFPEIDFSSMDDLKVYNLIRAQVKPLSGAYVIIDEKRLHFEEFVPFDQIPLLRKKYTS